MPTEIAAAHELIDRACDIMDAQCAEVTSAELGFMVLIMVSQFSQFLMDCVPDEVENWHKDVALALQGHNRPH
jgi:hypothetical protein